MSIDTNLEFSSIQYWRDRHSKYGSDPTGVGNVCYSTEENAEIYRKTDIYLRAILKELTHQGNPCALDLGCGIGMLSKAFTESGYSYTGVDCSETAIAIARQNNPAGKFFVGNIADRLFDSKSDVIIERTVFVHLIEDSYWLSVLDRIKESLSPTGTFVMMDYIPKTPSDISSTVKHVKQRTILDYETVFDHLQLHFDMSLRTSIGKHVALSENTHFIRHSNY